jgi:hypothetical protein
MNLFRDLERAIDEKLRSLFSADSPAASRKELVELQRAILDDVADHAQLLPRAKRALTTNHILIRIPAPEEDRRAALQLVFVDANALAEEIKRYLQQEQIEFPRDLTVDVELLDQDVPETAAIKGFVAVYTKQRVTEERDAPKAELRPVRLTPISTDAPPTEVMKSRVHIGRSPEVLDEKRRLVRRNDVAIDEQTVSRAHAHLIFDAETQVFRLFDDGSSYGTSVLHDGRLVEVPKAGGRGQRLTSGDEIYFGQARVKFEVL